MNLPIQGMMLLTFFCTVVFMLILRPLARGLGLVDVPGGRKNHVGEVPLIGGVAIFLGFIFGLSIWPAVMLKHLYFLVAGLLIVGTGVLDDRFDIRAALRLLIQVTAALFLVFGAGMVVTSVGDPIFIGELRTGSFAIPVTVILVVGIINAVNMVDGIDGLAASLSSITFLFLFMASGSQLALNAGLLALLVATVSFMLFNFPARSNRKVRAFLGDAGSTFLGLAVAWYAIGLTQGSGAVLSPVTAMWFFALPIIDLIGSMIRRMRKGRSPFSADRMHFHHILQRAGLDVPNTLAAMTLMSLMFALVGLIGEFLQIGESWMFVTFLLFAFAYHWCMRRAWVLSRWLRRQRFSYIARMRAGQPQ